MAVKFKHCIALLGSAQTAESGDQRLFQELMDDLDRQGVKLEAWHHDRLPAWVRRAAWLGLFWYAFRLLCHSPALVFLQVEFPAGMGWFMPWLSWSTRHRFWIFIQAGHWPPHRQGTGEAPPFFQSSRIGWGARLGLRAADWVIADSKMAVQGALAEGVPGHRIKRLPSGKTGFASWLRRNPGSNQPLRIGTLVDEDAAGFPLLLEALSQVRVRSRPTVQVLTRGRMSPRPSENIRSKVKEYGLENSVSFFSWESGRLAIFCQCDLFVIPEVTGHLEEVEEISQFGLPVLGLGGREPAELYLLTQTLEFLQQDRRWLADLNWESGCLGQRRVLSWKKIRRRFRSLVETLSI